MSAETAIAAFFGLMTGIIASVTVFGVITGAPTLSIVPAAVMTGVFSMLTLGIAVVDR